MEIANRMMSPLILIAYSLLSPSYRTAYRSAYPR
jgi:hypothetical protein